MKTTIWVARSNWHGTDYDNYVISSHKLFKHESNMWCKKTRSGVIESIEPKTFESIFKIKT